MSDRRIAASMSCSPKCLDSAYGSCGRIGCSSSIGAYSGSHSRSGKKNPGTVSLDTLTNRGTPKRTAASSTLNVACRLLANTTCDGWCCGSGIAAEWMTASWPRTTANA
jgi:hypothetical protein